MGIKDKITEKLVEKFANDSENYSDEERSEAVFQAKELGRMIMADELAEKDRKIAELESEIDVFNEIAEKAYANENCFRLHIERNQKGTPFFEECNCSICSHAMGCFLGEEDEWKNDVERCTLTEIKE